MGNVKRIVCLGRLCRYCMPPLWLEVLREDLLGRLLGDFGRLFMINNIFDQ